MWEVIMLVCFGLSWPASLLKSIKSKSTKGKSILFLWLIAFGYLSGVINKLLTGYDPVMWLYVLNGAMVLADTAMYYINKRNEKRSIA
jgi:uncharacterized protein with PQ loop repeat